MEKQWYLSFDINPGKKLRSTSVNIVYSSFGSVSKINKDVIPVVSFNRKTKKLHICRTVKTNKNYCFNYSNLPNNRYTNVQVRQTWNTKSNVYQYIITINGVVRQAVTNTRAQVFKNVKVWTNYPYQRNRRQRNRRQRNRRNKRNSFIKNLVFQNLPSGKYEIFPFY